MRVLLVLFFLLVILYVEADKEVEQVDAPPTLEECLKDLEGKEENKGKMGVGNYHWFQIREKKRKLRKELCEKLIKQHENEKVSEKPLVVEEIKPVQQKQIVEAQDENQVEEENPTYSDGILVIRNPIKRVAKKNAKRSKVNKAKKSNKARKQRRDGTTTTDDCKDLVPNCARALSYCNTAKLKPTLEQNCKKSCGFCTPAPATSNDDNAGEENICVDASSSCAQWNKNGFCTSTFHDEATKKRLCALTCTLCEEQQPDDGTDTQDDGTQDDNNPTENDPNSTQTRSNSKKLNKKSKKTQKTKKAKKIQRH